MHSSKLDSQAPPLPRKHYSPVSLSLSSDSDLSNDDALSKRLADVKQVLDTLIDQSKVLLSSN